MGSGWHEQSLMIFTAFGQCVAGGFIILTLTLLKDGLQIGAQQCVIACMFGLWVLMGTNLIAPMLHLGSSVRTFNLLNRVGTSALSNEIASGSILLAVGDIGWLLVMLKGLSPALCMPWLIVMMVLGITFVQMVVRVYNSTDTAPTWYGIWTPMGFFLAMFMGGLLLGYLLLSLADVDDRAMCLLPAISVLVLVVNGVVSVIQGTELATIHSFVQQAAVLMPDYGMLMPWRIMFLAVTLCLWIAPQPKDYQPAVPLFSVSSILLLIGELISRDVFYGLRTTVGMATIN